MSTENTGIYAENELPLDRCPHCGVKKPRLAIGSRMSTADCDGGSKRVWSMYPCSSCGGVVTVSTSNESELVLEIYPSARLINSSIPERARRHLQEAMDTLHSPSASIVAAASAVDALLKGRNYREGSLYHRIDLAATQHLITAEMALWAHQVRLDANDQRHADEEAPFPEPEDARLCLDFAFALAEILFVLPSRVTRGIEQASASASASPSRSPSASPSAS